MGSWNGQVEQSGKQSWKQSGMVIGEQSENLWDDQSKRCLLYTFVSKFSD